MTAARATGVYDEKDFEGAPPRMKEPSVVVGVPMVRMNIREELGIVRIKLVFV